MIGVLPPCRDCLGATAFFGKRSAESRDRGICRRCLQPRPRCRIGKRDMPGKRVQALAPIIPIFLCLLRSDARSDIWLLPRRAVGYTFI
nr:MAG TPA: Protein of unknown function (DUF2688) [Caudoviricetes sp.]